MPELVVQGLVDAINNSAGLYNARSKEERDRLARERDYQWREKQAADAREHATALQTGQQQFLTGEREARDTREERLYNERFDDQMIQQLKLEGYLTTKDQGDPDKVAAAQIAASKETQQAMDELAKLKVAAGHIMEVAKGAKTGVEGIFSLKVADLAKARTMVETGFEKANAVTAKDEEKSDRNETGGARLWAQNAIAKAKISQERGILQANAERLTSGRFNDAELAQGMAQARADPMNAKLIGSKVIEDMEKLKGAARQKAADNSLMTIGQMKAQFQSLAERDKVTEDQDRTIAVLVHNKVAGAIDWAGVQRASGVGGDGAAAGKVAGSPGDFLKFKAGGGKPGAAPSAIAGDTYTQIVPGAVGGMAPAPADAGMAAEAPTNLPGAAPFAFSNEDAAAARAASVANAPRPAPPAPAEQSMGGLIGAGQWVGNKIVKGAGGAINLAGNAPGLIAQGLGGDKLFNMYAANKAQEDARARVFSDDVASGRFSQATRARDAQIKAEDEILRTAPQSEAAKAIKINRGISAPVNLTPSSLLHDSITGGGS